MDDTKTTKAQVAYVTNPNGQVGLLAQTHYRDWIPGDGIHVKRVDGGFILTVGNQTRVCADLAGLSAVLASLFG